MKLREIVKKLVSLAQDEEINLGLALESIGINPPQPVAYHLIANGYVKPRSNDRLEDIYVLTGKAKKLASGQIRERRKKSVARGKKVLTLLSEAKKKLGFKRSYLEKKKEKIEVKQTNSSIEKWVVLLDKISKCEEAQLAVQNAIELVKKLK